MIDVSKYKKIGEYRNGVMKWLSSGITNVVYLIMFGGESYIGSTKDIRSRFCTYIPKFQNGSYSAMKVQRAFDNNKCFDLYVVEFTSKEKLREREAFYINTLHPNLNTRTFANYVKRKSQKPKKISILKQHDRNYKGIQTYISMTDYKRLSTFKIYRNKTISELVSEAIDLWLDVQEGEKNVCLV